KKLIYILLLMLPFFATETVAQVVNAGSGKINNAKSGTIRIKVGTFVPGTQDTIGGRVVFESKPQQSQQSVPNIVYNQLEIANKATKLLGSLKDATGRTKNLVVRDSLIIRDTANLTTNWIGLDAEDVIAKGHMKNTARFSGDKRMIVGSESAAQDMLGNGSYSNLVIDNPYGVNIKDAGFTVEDTLILQRGQVRNTAENNFKMADSSKIIRYAASSVDYALEFDKTVDVRYTGDGSILTGGEIPDSANVLQELIVENTGGVVMTKDIQVNKRFYLNTRFCTEFDSIRKYVLTYTPALNPEFGEHPLVEVEGTFRRTGLLYDSTSMLFNNKYTWALFRNSIDSSKITAMNFRIKPREFFRFIPDASNRKVKRTFEIWAENANRYDSVKLVSAVDVGYAWRNDHYRDTLDETRGLTPASLKLIRRNDDISSWQEIASSSVPELSADSNWYYAHATNVDLLGRFVVGISEGDVYLQARVYLEGAYFADSIMSNDLYTYNLLQVTPRDEYPYNLDPNRLNVKSKLATMDSVVDWVVIEFRSETRGNFYYTALLMKDGTILSPDGSTQMNLSKAQIDSGDYYIGILHRNHLPIYTQEKFRMTTENNGQLADFTKSENVYGKDGALKLIDMTGGFLLYGMVAGDVNGDNIIDETDYRLTWENRDLQYRWSRYDINMSGYVNTKDINFPWNNLERTAKVPLP
ncbi:MAG: hypothetical protein PHV24_03845, partial [Candidatus Kapabacteria bacterium]|nr:hypothetical protein [Candidatus Kapabacteria bacterium]